MGDLHVDTKVLVEDGYGNLQVGVIDSLTKSGKFFRIKLANGSIHPSLFYPSGAEEAEKEWHTSFITPFDQTQWDSYKGKQKIKALAAKIRDTVWVELSLEALQQINDIVNECEQAKMVQALKEKSSV